MKIKEALKKFKAEPNKKEKVRSTVKTILYIVVAIMVVKSVLKII